MERSIVNCPECKEEMIGIQYGRFSSDHPEHWDGVSEWRCDKCGTRIGRFSGKKLQNDEYEPARLRFKEHGEND